MLVGLDFDNTIVSYDDLFHRVAREWDLIPADLPATKQDVRDFLRRNGQEDRWTEMQGYVYGRRMEEASPFPGVAEFFETCRVKQIPLAIISHKTRYPYRGPKYDLHTAARDWLAAQPFVNKAWVEHNVFFELTKEDKLERIARENCTHFVDDLPEFLTMPGFPNQTQPILFSPAPMEVTAAVRIVYSWKDLTTLVTHELRRLNR